MRPLRRMYRRIGRESWRHGPSTWDPQIWYVRTIEVSPLRVGKSAAIRTLRESSVERVLFEIRTTFQCRVRLGSCFACERSRRVLLAVTPSPGSLIAGAPHPRAGRLSPRRPTRGSRSCGRTSRLASTTPSTTTPESLCPSTETGGRSRSSTWEYRGARRPRSARRCA